MVSVLATTQKYILQPSLLDMHRQSLEWLSASELWKRELSFFQKLLDQSAPRDTAEDHKQQVGHFQSLITYYDGELVDTLRKKLREHESRLAHTLKELKESDTTYFKEHSGIMEELESFLNAFAEFKQTFFGFIESSLKKAGNAGY
jgi:hypothetical protein